MKILLAILIASNLAIIWFCILKDNVHVTFGVKSQPEEEITEEIADDLTSDGEEPIIIRLSDLRGKVKEMVHDEYMEMLNVKDTTVEPTNNEVLNNEQMERAFADDLRTDSIADGQLAGVPSPDDDDDSMPSFGQLDESMRTIGNPNSTSAERHKAVEAALTITDTDIVVTLPEPLHSRFRDAMVEYQAKQIEAEPEYKVTKIIAGPRQALPDNPENFNLRDYKR